MHQPDVFDGTNICAELTGMSLIIFFQSNFIPAKLFAILVGAHMHKTFCSHRIFKSQKVEYMLAYFFKAHILQHIQALSENI
jgi:hypothetical protein